jgi:hypothetical protein
MTSTEANEVPGQYCWTIQFNYFNILSTAFMKIFYNRLFLPNVSKYENIKNILELYIYVVYIWKFDTTNITEKHFINLQVN